MERVEGLVQLRTLVALTGYQPHEILKSAVISSGLKWPFGLNDARTRSAAFEKISFVKIISWTSLVGRPRRFVGALVFISGLKSRNKLPRRIGEIQPHISAGYQPHHSAGYQPHISTFVAHLRTHFSHPVLHGSPGGSPVLHGRPVRAPRSPRAPC